MHTVIRKTVILFASSHGTTEKAARMLADKLRKKGVITDVQGLNKNPVIDLDYYDTVIIGGSIHAGIIQKSVKHFVQKNLLHLLNKRVGLFLCCMQENEAQNEFDRAYPALLRQHALSKKILGGEFLFERMNFLERIIVKKIAGINSSVTRLYPERLDEMVDEIVGSDA